VRERLEFTLVFTDEDGVKGSRQIDIGTRADTEPKLEGFEPEIVRKTNEGYKITASARIPFRGIVLDDQGLSKVRYAWTLTADKIGSEATKANTIEAFGLTLKLPAEPEPPVNAADVHYLGVPAFDQNLRADFLAPGRVRDMLREEQGFGFRSLVTRFRITPDDWIKPTNETAPRREWKYPRADDEKLAPLACDFPVWDLKVKALGKKVQQHYTMKLWAEAVDTDLDSDAEKDGTPKPHQFATNRITFKIVSEPVLLAEIAREEGELQKRFKEMFENLQNREAKLAELVSELDRGAFKDPEVAGSLEKQVNTMIGNLAVTSSSLEKNKEVVAGVRKDYERILKELRVNQVETGSMIVRVGTAIVEPLLQVEEDEFPAASKGVADFSRALDRAKGMNNVTEITGSTRASARLAQERIKELKDKLRNVLEAMEQIEGINQLIKQLVKIEGDEKEQEELYRKILQDVQRKAIEGLTDPPKP